MNNILRIEGDPAFWILADAQIQEVAAELGESGDPVILDVVAPLRGRLVLSATSAGSVALLSPPGGDGWIPSGIDLPSAHLYVPSATGPTADAPGYALARSAEPLNTASHDGRLIRPVNTAGSRISGCRARR